MAVPLLFLAVRSSAVMGMGGKGWG